ncbi:hypothetical protein SESBI_11269 [Sesbania bispinosa]|nr:hypothetical protein SESBI_11269 [Sesbania bispinosa]
MGSMVYYDGMEIRHDGSEDYPWTKLLDNGCLHALITDDYAVIDNAIEGDDGEDIKVKATDILLVNRGGS